MSSSNTKNLDQLTVEEVTSLLEAINLGAFVIAFRENSVDGATLTACDEVNDLVSLGITLVPKAKMLFAKLSSFKSSGVSRDLLSSGVNSRAITPGAPSRAITPGTPSRAITPVSPSQPRTKTPNPLRIANIHSPESTYEKFDNKIKFIKYDGNTDFNDVSVGKIFESALFHSMEEECCVNDGGRWRKDYEYVVNEVATEQTLDPAIPHHIRDQGHSGMHLWDFVNLPEARAVNLTEAEVAAIRLYTGPFSTPWNAALREYDTDPLKFNSWVTCISVLDQAILKLCQKPINVPVFCGMNDIESRFPKEFLEVSADSVVRGLDPAFMSTTLEPTVAIEYSSRRGNASDWSLLEIAVDLANGGANLQPFSQYPNEREVLYSPYTWLTVDQVRIVSGGPLNGIRYLTVRASLSSARPNTQGIETVKSRNEVARAMLDRHAVAAVAQSPSFADLVAVMRGAATLEEAVLAYGESSLVECALESLPRVIGESAETLASLGSFPWFLEDLVMVMTKHLSTPKLTQLALVAVRKLCRYNDDKSSNNANNLVRMGTTGMIEVSIQATRAHLDDVAVCEAACTAISALAYCNNDNLTKLGGCGTCEMVISILNKFGMTHPEVAQRGLSAVGNLAFDDENCTKLGVSGACQLVVTLLGKYGTTHPSVAQRGFSAVSNLSYHDENCTNLGVSGACELVVTVLSKYGMSHTDLALLGLHAIADLAGHDDNSIKLGVSGACELVVSLLKKYGMSQPDVAQWGLHAVANLASHNCTKLGLSGACELVVTILNMISTTRPEVAEWGLHAIANLAAYGDNCTKLGVSGACELVTILLNKYGMTHTDVALWGLHAAANLAVDDDNCRKLGVSGACEVVVTILRNVGMTQSDVAQWGLHAVANLAANDGNCSKLGISGACELVVTLLHNSGTSYSEDSQWGLHAVANLAAHDDNCINLGVSGACELVVTILNSIGLTHEDVALWGLHALANLAANDDNCTELGEVGACEEVIIILNKYGLTHPDVADYGLWAVANLAAQDDNRAELGEAGACEVVTKLFDFYMGQSVVNQGIATYSTWAVLHLVCGSNKTNINKMKTLGMKVKLQSKIVDNNRVTDSEAKGKARAAIACI